MNPYNILGVNQNATDDEIKKAYKKLAMKHHPDKGGDEGKFKEITEAYRRLTEEKSEENYDASDFFSSFFRGGPFGGGPFGGGPFGGGPFGGGEFREEKVRENRVKVTKKHVTISMKDAYHGTKKNIRIELQDTCNNCIKICTECNGSGMRKVLRKSQVGHAIMVHTTTVKCTCNNGKIKFLNNCNECNNTGFINYKKQVQLIIEPGTENNKMFKFSNIIPNNEIIFNIHIEPMPGYKIDRNNLVYTYSITLTDALLGKIIEIDHPSNEKVKLDTFDMKNILIDKQILNIPKKGMTTNNDMKIIINVKYPNSKNQNRKSVEDIRELLNSYLIY